MPEKSNEIAELWCTYGRSGHLWGFGKIEKIDEDRYYVRDSERQEYELQLWGSEGVTRFNTLEQAVEYYIKNRPATDPRWGETITDDEIRRKAKLNFPSYFKEKSPISN